MKYKIVFQKAAEKFLKKQDRKTQERLLAAISRLPQGTDIKKLQGYNNMYRMRLGSIRVLYTLDDVIKIISIENIDNRGDVYKTK
ncbi:MAG: type II toxin-antitoxin system RelE/ParE family toxin [Roseburia sp.]|nr:type II toxin-antitoxin system RelE/ParE family toxin [Roseburia sp.]